MREPALLGATLHTPEVHAPVAREPAAVGADTTPGDTQVLDQPTPHSDASGVSHTGSGVTDSSSGPIDSGAGSPPNAGDSVPGPPTHTPPVPHAFDSADAHGYSSGDAYRPGNAEVTVPLDNYVRGSGVPDWTHITTPDRPWADYQMQIAGIERAADGRIPEWAAVTPDGDMVKFDGHVERAGPPPVEVPLDAKDGYRGLAFNAPEKGIHWGYRAESLITQAGRQIDARPDGALIEWHVSDEYGAAAIQRMLEGERITPDDIRVMGLDPGS